MSYQLHLGDCLDILPTLESESIDAITTDPPYGLSFMGKAWDNAVPSVDVWRECLRVLKPGGHLLCFAGTRTQHRMATAIEDAGFEIRDMIAWVYGSGFPKSLDVSKAIDKAAGAERDVVGTAVSQGGRSGSTSSVGQHLIDAGKEWDITAPATPEAQQWQGWGTALKPALEPITVARKPISGTVAANVLQHGTGAINVDACRVGTESTTTVRNGNSGGERYGRDERTGSWENPPGRFPANLIHDGSDEVTRLFPETGASNKRPPTTGPKAGDIYGNYTDSGYERGHDDDGGSAARFFYMAKASKRDRNEGCEGMADSEYKMHRPPDSEKAPMTNKNAHPTVKPTDLMRYLVRLVTPPGGVVLDPFTGSGSTGKACMYEGFSFIGCELDPEYIEIATARIEYAIHDDGVDDEPGQLTMFDEPPQKWEQLGMFTRDGAT